MTTYAIGDIQGCFEELQRLLEKIKFDKTKDTLWFAGDIVNRGPKSLETLRFVKSLGNSAITVLGNHDMHLTAVAKGYAKLKTHDTIDEILQAEDCNELIEWLCEQPFLHHDPKLGYTMVHAGILPAWSLDEAIAYNHELTTVLQGKRCDYFLKNMYGDLPNCWSNDLKDIERWRFILNVFTRMRFCLSDTCITLSFSGKVEQAPENFIPWFNVMPRKMAKQMIAFGHWAALQGVTKNPFAIALDTGCAWGEKLTAINLTSHQRYSV